VSAPLGEVHQRHLWAGSGSGACPGVSLQVSRLRDLRTQRRRHRVGRFHPTGWLPVEGLRLRSQCAVRFLRAGAPRHRLRRAAHLLD
jgi:hypothetical protein